MTSSGELAAAAVSAPSTPDALRVAFTHFSVNVLGILILGAIYLNYVLLVDYVRPLFWAAVMSVPLHGIKKTLVKMVVSSARRKGDAAWKSLGLTVAKVVLQNLLGAVYLYPVILIKAYFHLVARISQVDHASNEGGPVDDRDESSSSDEDEEDDEGPQLPPIIKQSMSISRSHSLGLLAPKTQAATQPPPPQEVPTSALEGGQKDKAEAGDVKPTNQKAVEFARDTMPSRKESEVDVPTSNNPSQIYFWILFRCCGFYISYLAIKSIGLDYLLITIVLLLGIMGSYLVYHVLLRYVKIYVGEFYGKMKSRFNDAISERENPVIVLLLKAVKVISQMAPLEWFRDRYKRSRKEARAAFVKNANSAIATLLVVTSIFGVLAFSVLLTFKFVNEANLSKNHLVSLVDRQLSPEMHEQVRSGFQQAYMAAVSFGDTKLQELYPGANLTVQSLYEKAFEVKNASHTAVATVAKPMVPGMPYVSAALRSASEGDFGSLADTSLLFTVVAELRAAGLDTVQAMYMSSGYQQYVTMASEYLSSAASSILAGTVGVLFRLVSFVVDATMFFTQVTLFLFALHYLISNRYAMTDYLSQILALTDPKQFIRRTLERSIRGVLLVTIKLAAFHFLFTWLTFSALGVEIVYIPSFLCALFAAVPLVPPFWLAVPASLSLYLQDRPWASVFLTISHFAVYMIADPAIYGEIPEVSPFFSGMAILLGLYTFGIEGLVLGPLLMAVIPALYQFIAQSIASDSVMAAGEERPVSAQAGDMEATAESAAAGKDEPCSTQSFPSGSSSPSAVSPVTADGSDSKPPTPPP